MPSRLDITLRKYNRQIEEERAQQIALSKGLAYDVLDNYPFNFDSLSLVPLKQVKERSYGVYLRTSHKVEVAIVNPEDPEATKELEEFSKVWNREVSLTVVSPSSIAALIAVYEKFEQENDEEIKLQAQQRNQDERTDYFKHIKTLKDLQEIVHRVSVTELLDVIIAAAFNQDASDIHIEPGEEQLTIRYRIDGVLQKVLELPMAQHHPIVSRIKVLAHLKMDTEKNALDGRFGLQNKGIDADLRVSAIPTGYGEAIVMRILRQDVQAMTIEQLGFSDHDRELIERVIKKPYGLILVTGPTGSGKSTTLYALLAKLNSSEKKIITLEDPIEYKLEGLQQSQVDPDKGFTFADGLRGALRQDPDIVMVGEIRDPETATIALNASLTGHLVLSTLHTNNAVTAQTRFLEMGIPPFLLNGSIQMIIAQRLVRKLVPGSDPANPEYKGRIVIAEVLCPNQEFEQAAIASKDTQTLQSIAEKGGMIPMIKDGLEKVQTLQTTESEIYRVTEA